MQPKKLLAALLALSTTLVMAMAAPAALADEDGQHGDGAHGDGFHMDGKHFEDIEDSPWASLSIEKAFQLGLMRGDGMKHFNPHAPLRREEAVVVAVRLMGLGIQGTGDVSSSFSDADKIDAWASGAVAVAVQKGILPPSDDGAFHPHEPATRLWTSVLLVKALGLDAEAQSKMSVQLTFEDANAIPSQYIGYVAVSLDHHLITGYENHTFRPDKPVTRAEMSALLSRADDQLVLREHRHGELHGTVQTVDVTNAKLTVQSPNATLTAKVAADAAIFVDQRHAALSDVQVGMTVWLRLNDSMEITMIDARSADHDDTGLVQTVNGTLTAVTPAQGVTLGVISLQTEAGSSVTAAVAPAAVITGASGAITMADLHVGDQVQVKLVAGIVIAIEDRVTTPPPPANTTVSGSVLAVAAPTATGAGSITVQPANGGSNVTASVTSSTQVTLHNADGSITTKTIADVSVGNAVLMNVAAGVATSIQIVAPAVTVQGFVLNLVRGVDTSTLTLGPVGGGSPVVVTLRFPGTTITGNTGAIPLGSEVQVTYVTGVASSVVVLVPAVTVQGSVTSIAYPSATAAGSITIAPDGGGANVTSTIYGYTVVTLLGSDGSTQTKAIADVHAGDRVQAAAAAGVVSRIQISQPAASYAQGVVMWFTAPSGTTAGTLMLLPDGSRTAVSYSIASTVTVTHGATTKSFADVSVNGEVRLTLSGGVVTNIELL